LSGAIAGTADPTLYQTGRYGNFSYSFPLPNGTYTVTLKFAEPNRNGPGRVFHVNIEGQRVLTNYDIFVDVGYLHAVDKQFVAQVADGALDIVFTSVSDAAIVSAIQVVDGAPPGGTPTVTATATPPATNTAASTGTPTTGVTPQRTNAGGPAYTDSSGQVWTADSGASGGGTYGTGVAVSGTADSTLYQTGRYGNFSYNFPVPNGTYTVTLKFA